MNTEREDERMYVFRVVQMLCVDNCEVYKLGELVFIDYEVCIVGLLTGNLNLQRPIKGCLLVFCQSLQEQTVRGSGVGGDM